MIGLSKFRTAVVKEPLVKVAYVSPETVESFEESHILQSDPGYLGTGCLVEVSPNCYQLKVVGVGLENVLTQDTKRRARAYRWILDESEVSCFVSENASLSSEERIQTVLEHRDSVGIYPEIEVWVLDQVTEQIFDHDISVEAPQGEYRSYRFISILSYPLYNEHDVFVKYEYIALVSDL